MTSATFDFSLVTIVDPVPYGKSFELSPEGQLVRRVHGHHRRGMVRRVRTDFDGLCAVLRDAQPGQHLVAGVPPIEVDAEVALAAEKLASPGVLTRTKDHMPFPAGPGLMVIDVDGIGDVELVRDQLGEACAELDEAALIATTSSSSNIARADGEVLRAASGLHLLVPVADARDIPRALRVLFDRLWLAGHGRLAISEAGRPLLRSAVDLAMLNPAQPVFLAAHCSPGLQQRRQRWMVRGGDQALFDTRALVDLSATETEQLQRLQRQAVEEAADALADARQAWQERRVAELTARGVDAEQARAQCAAASESGDLSADWLLTLADGRRVTVADVLADRQRFHAMPCRDPLEPEYGSPSVAKLYTDQDKPILRSHAHGGCTYHLHPTTAAQQQAAARSGSNLMKAANQERASDPAPPAPRPAASGAEPQLLDLVELCAKPWPPTSWAIDGLIPHAHVTLLSANGGVGKSTLALQAAVSVATGAEFLGLPTSKGRVMLFSAEDGDAILHSRLAHIAAASGARLSELAESMIVLDATRCDATMWSDTGAAPRLAWLANVCKQERPSLLVIDNASDVFVGNENDRAQVRGFVRALAGIADELECAVLLLAHVDKASVRGLVSADTLSTFSGSTAWHNSARSRLAMTRDSDDLVTLRHEKSNLGRLVPDIELEFDTAARLFRRAGTIPGQAAARALVRSQHRLAVLRLIHAACGQGRNLSSKPRASTNAYLQLHAEPGYPTALDRREFFALLSEMQRDGLLQEVEVTTASRNRVNRLQLTPTGELRVAAGSAAPAMWRAKAAA